MILAGLPAFPCRAQNNHTEAPAPGLPPAFSAYYDVKIGPLKVGEATRILTWNSSTPHEYTSTLKTTGFAGYLLKKSETRVTHFDIHNRLLRPLDYAYSDNKGNVVAQQFDWHTDTAHSTIGVTKRTYPLEKGSLDQNVYPLQIMQDLAQGKKEMMYHITENKKLKDFHIKLQKKEAIDTYLGRLDTLVVHADTEFFSTSLWCAPSLQYLPVQIQYAESGLTFTAYLTRLEGAFPLLPSGNID